MPPAFEMAAQNFGVHSHIMAPQRMGYRMPNISVMAVLNIFFSFERVCGSAPLCRSS